MSVKSIAALITHGAERASLYNIGAIAVDAIGMIKRSEDGDFRAKRSTTFRRRKCYFLPRLDMDVEMEIDASETFAERSDTLPHPVGFALDVFESLLPPLFHLIYFTPSRTSHTLWRASSYLFSHCTTLSLSILHHVFTVLSMHREIEVTWWTSE